MDSVHRRQAAILRDFKNTIVERVHQDPTFAKALLDEAAT
jgi:hypothetical protein